VGHLLRSNLFKVFGIDQVGGRIASAYTAVSGLVASADQVRIAARVKGEQNAIGFALMLNAQFFMLGTVNLSGIHLGRPAPDQLRQRLNHIVDAAAFLVSQRFVPFLELVADFDLQAIYIIPRKRYSVKGIIICKMGAKKLTMKMDTCYRTRVGGTNGSLRSIIATLLEAENYWVRRSFKVNVTKEKNAKSKSTQFRVLKSTCLHFISPEMK